MDQSSEINTSDMSVIRHQMDETRSALTEKLERLEQKVTNTVQGAVQSVGDTVENVKHVVDDTVESVRSSVQSVKSSVQDTVQTVKSSVNDTVHAVGEALSIPHHVERHPWAMMAGATALGFVGGYILMSKSGDARAEEKFRHLAASQGRVPQPQYVPEQHFAPAETPNRTASRSATSSMTSSNGTNAFSEWLRPAASQVQSLAVGAALSLVREMLINAVPKPMTGQVTELVDGLTTSLGGQVIRGNLLEQLPTKPR